MNLKSIFRGIYFGTGVLVFFTTAHAEDNGEMKDYLEKQTQQATNKANSQGAGKAGNDKSGVQIIQGKTKTFKLAPSGEQGNLPTIKSSEITISPEFVFTKDQPPPAPIDNSEKRSNAP